MQVSGMGFASIHHYRPSQAPEPKNMKFLINLVIQKIEFLEYHQQKGLKGSYILFSLSLNRQQNNLLEFI